ncbi:MAG: hypothetical protein RMJ28_00400 [Nitrososphaerota archaeon]|nr:hypothetical protein [Candidatus Calditenuaceae archaeon]MDW8072693.1 hypothetical protein [Nitrososphaerota archaeon]
MRKRLLASTVILLALLGLIPLAAHAQAGELFVERRVSVSPYGLVYVWDSINNVPAGTNLEVGIPDKIHSSLKNLQVFGATLTGQETREEHTYYILTPTSSQIVMRHVYSGLVILRGDNSYSLISPLSPVIAKIDYSFDMFIDLPSDAQVANPPKGFTLEGATLVQRGVRSTEHPAETLTVSFTSTDLQLITGERVVLTYDLDSNMVIARIKLRNDDSRNLVSVSLNLPEALQVVEVGDYSGTVKHSVSGRTLNVEIYPDRFEVQRGWKYEFSVKARIREGSNITERAPENIRLKTFQPLNATIEDYLVEVILPKTVALASADKFSEIYRDDAGRVVARLQEGLVNPYVTETVVLNVTTGGASPILPQALIIAILAVSAAGFIAYSGAARARGAQAVTTLDQATAQKIIRQLSELRSVLEELDEIAGLRRGEVKQVQMQPSISRLRSKYDALRETLDGIKGGEQVSRLARDVQRGMSEIGETLKMLSRSYGELQRGEISRGSYVKIYRALRGDVRELISALAEAENTFKTLAEKG